MAVRTKPVRILDADHGALRLLADLEGRSPALVIHSALAEYLERHREDIGTMFAEAQAAIAAGDLNELARQLEHSAERHVDELVAQLDELR